MKTVLTELIEMLEKTVPAIRNGNAIDKAYWLEKEKLQLEKTYEEGFLNIIGQEKYIQSFYKK